MGNLKDIKIKNRLWFSFFFIFFCFVSLAAAQDKIVVIPLFGSEQQTGPPAPVEKTGQTTCYSGSHSETECSGTGQDGDHQNGVAWPDPRFTDNGDGTVTDNLTGLVWLKNITESNTWNQSVVDCNNLADDGVNLTDGSSAGEWRLPNIKELQSLIDFGNLDPALPTSHPFIGAKGKSFWAGTTDQANPSAAWYMGIYDGKPGTDMKWVIRHIWPVRNDN